MPEAFSRIGDWRRAMEPLDAPQKRVVHLGHRAGDAHAVAFDPFDRAFIDPKELAQVGLPEAELRTDPAAVAGVDLSDLRRPARHDFPTRPRSTISHTFTVPGQPRIRKPKYRSRGASAARPGLSALVPSTHALKLLLTDTTSKLEKFQSKGDAAAFQAHVENVLLKEELKEKNTEVKQTKEQAQYFVQRLQVEQDDTVPVVLMTFGALSGVGTLIGMWGHGYAKTNYPDSGFAKAATPLLGAVVAGGTYMLSEVTPEEKAKGIRPDYTTMAGGLGLGGGIIGGAGYQIWQDYKAANP